LPYDNKNSGALFRDQDKKNPKAPDYTGKLDVEGKEYRIAGWLRGGQNGKFLSLKIEEPMKRPNRPAAPGAPADDRDEIPF
jgi:uncharacterized protein (DUF736 family)